MRRNILSPRREIDDLEPPSCLCYAFKSVNLSIPLKALHAQCRTHVQIKPTPLILKYGKGGFNTMHQDLYGEIYFPLQCVFFLNDGQTDFTGGEFVLTQQAPRAQSRAIVLKPSKGDMLVLTTNFRPVQGSRVTIE